MTREAIQQLAEAERERYRRATRKEKHGILEHFCAATGYHRKSAIRLLRSRPTRVSGRRGRPSMYGAELVAGLKVAWEATMCVCSKRLAPFLAELVPNLEEKGLLRVSSQVHDQLIRVSASTIDRLLRPFRDRRRHGVATTRSAGGFRRLVPVRTFADKQGLQVGDVEVDLVAHCGTSSEGFFLNTLVMVDTVSGWTELEAVWGKGEDRVGGAIERARRRFPCPLRGINSDNGSEFMNYALFHYCKRHGITLTRSRPYKKNDQARVEQKNWSVVRKLVGYDRYNSRASLVALEDLYTLIRLHVNFFQPICKLVSSHREGARVQKQFDRGQTPYQRLLASGSLSQKQRQALKAIYDDLNPVQLCAEIETAQQRLWQLAQPDMRTSKENRILAAIDGQMPVATRSATDQPGNSTSEATTSLR
ncbi:MAG TPA: DDE-type integrase/transposase/recombinase [Anaerolineae bacterium]|nr:DDE-type integrase/transposase/recombinase [Anaerolineae bacterium]